MRSISSSRPSPLRDEDSTHVGSILMFEDVSIGCSSRNISCVRRRSHPSRSSQTGVAHGVRTTLSVLSKTILFSSSPWTWRRRRRKTSQIEKELGRIVEAVGSLLSYSHFQQNPVRSVELPSLIERRLLFWAVYRDKNVTLDCVNSGEKIYIRGDENKLKQLFINLMVNGIEAVAPGGTVSVDVSKDNLRGEAVIKVSDNGVGVPSQLAADIFKPFFTTKMTKKNIGLGLSICQNIWNVTGG